MIGISVVNWVMRERGWTFDDAPGVIPDPIHGAKCLDEIYTQTAEIRGLRSRERRVMWPGFIIFPVNCPLSGKLLAETGSLQTASHATFFLISQWFLE